MYTEKEVKYLRQNYNKFTNKELAIYLGKSNRSIERKLRNLGLKKGKRGSWLKEETEYLNKNYDKFSNKELSKYLGRSINSVLLKGNKLYLTKDSDYINQQNRIKNLSKYKHLCKTCNDFGTESLHGLSIHLSRVHKDMDQSNYYKNNIGDVIKCHFCDEDGKFIGLIDGYRNLCESEDCISKSRNTQTIDYLLKQGYSEQESISRLEELNNNRVLNGNISIEENLRKNSNFTKEKSPNCKEFYLKRGYSKEESIKLSSDVVLNMQEISHKIRKENPDDYLHTYTNKIEYYLNKGYSKEESYLMLVDRQTTFSKEICIEKHGEEEGIKIWLNRQEKWHKNYKKSNFSKISQELYQSIWEITRDDIDDVFFASLDENKEIVNSNKNYEYRLKLDKSFILPDFFIPKLKKIIEFDGTYYHRPTTENKKREKERDSIIKNNGYSILHISENDYKQNKEKTIQKCIKFLRE